MTLSIVIVSWRVKDKLRANLEALFRSRTEFPFEVWLVDNASGDGTAKMVREHFPLVKVIANEKNLGFSAANNQALRQIKSDFILLLNPDMLVNEETLAQMIAWADDHPRAAIMGCRLKDPHGRTLKSVRHWPRLFDQLAIALKLPHLWPDILHHYLWHNFNYERVAQVDSIRGSFFLIRSSTLDKIGFLDERFFVWFEEVDYCRRAHEAGLEIWYTPVAECVDYIGQSFKQWPHGQAQKIFAQSQIKYFKKWHSPLAVSILILGWTIGALCVKVAKILKINAKTQT